MLLVKPNTLSESQRLELEELIATTAEIKVYRRAKVILYRNAGYTAEEIQEHTGYSERMQRCWVCRYRKEGIAGLFDRPRSGRPKQVRTQERQEETQEETQEIVSKLDYWERLTLEQMYAHHPKHYLRERAQMILLRDKGYSAVMVAEILGVVVRTVRQVFANYDREKLGGLYRKSGSGRISKLGLEQWKQVKIWVAKGSKGLGYRFGKWTTRSLRAYIEKRFNVKFSREWIRQKLHEFIRYSWTRGKKVYASPDDEKRKKERKRFCLQLLDLLKQAYNQEIILLCEDESIFTLFGEVGYSWSPVGKTQEVPSAGKKGRVVVFGAADPNSGRTHYRLEEDPINKETSLRFIKQLVRYYQKHFPGVPLVIVLDKHKGHTSHLVEDFVKEYEHVSLVNTPTQSPDLNPIERVWDWLSERMIKNDFFETKVELKKAIRHFFCYITGIKEQVISCLGDMQKVYSSEAGIEAKI